MQIFSPKPGHYYSTNLLFSFTIYVCKCTHHVVILYAVERQVLMLFIDNNNSAFSILYLALILILASVARELGLRVGLLETQSVKTVEELKKKSFKMKDSQVKGPADLMSNLEHEFLEW